MTDARSAAEAQRAAARDERLLHAIKRLERDGARHLLTEPAQEADLAGLEHGLALRLPASFRALLGRLGSGILYDRHEMFGPLSLQLHDIEFVPSLHAMRKLLSNALAPPLLPFHREGRRVHAFDLSHGADEPVPVRALDGSAAYPDFVTFLETVVLAGDAGADAGSAQPQEPDRQDQREADPDRQLLEAHGLRAGDASPGGQPVDGAQEQRRRGGDRHPGGPAR